MHSSQRLLLSLALAFSTLLCPVLASAQNVDSQRPSKAARYSALAVLRLNVSSRSRESHQVKSSRHSRRMGFFTW